MKITYDEEAKAWYVQLVKKIGVGESVKTKQFEGANGKLVVIDFDKKRRSLGNRNSVILNFNNNPTIRNSFPRTAEDTKIIHF